MLMKRMRFGGGRGVEHDHVVALLAPVLVDVHHRAELFHARKNREFLGLHAADAGRAQHRAHVGRDLLPVPLDLFLNVQFENRKPVGDRQRIGGLGVKQFSVEVEGIRQAVRRIDAHHQRAVVQFGQFHAGRGGQTRLSDAALAAE